MDIIGLTICAVLCGADNWVEVAEFGEAREEWLKTFLELPNGIPSHNTLGRVFSMIDGAEFERCFAEWVRQLAGLTSKVIAIAGQTSEGPTNLVERYDPQTDTWTRLADKPTAVSELSAVVLGEKIYVPGGKLADGQVTNRLEVFDPRKGNWESKAELPLTVSGYALAAYEGQMYLFGGWDGEQVVDQAWRYDPFNDVWHAASNLPSARAYATAAEVSGKIYVLGGWDGTQELQESLSFDPARDLEGEPAWQKEPNLPAACSDCSAESISGMLFVIGTNGIWQLNSPYLEWAQIPFNTIPTGQHGFSSAISPEGYLYFVGGQDAASASPGNALPLPRGIYDFYPECDKVKTVMVNMCKG